MNKQYTCDFGGWKTCNQSWNISPRNLCNSTFSQIEYSDFWM